MAALSCFHKERVGSRGTSIAGDQEKEYRLQCAVLAPPFTLLSGKLNITPLWKESCKFPKRVNGSCAIFARMWVICLDCNYLLLFLLNQNVGFLRVRTIFQSTWYFSSLTTVLLILYSLKFSLLFAQHRPIHLFSLSRSMIFSIIFIMVVLTATILDFI